MTTVSPGLTVSTGFCALSYHPTWVVSMVAGSRCTLPGEPLATTVDCATALAGARHAPMRKAAAAQPIFGFMASLPVGWRPVLARRAVCGPLRAILHMRTGTGQEADARTVAGAAYFAATCGLSHRLFGTTQCTFFSVAEIAPTRQSMAALASP